MSFDGTVRGLEMIRALSDREKVALLIKEIGKLETRLDQLEERNRDHENAIALLQRRIQR